MSYAKFLPKPVLVFTSIFFVLFSGDAEVFGVRVILLYSVAAFPVFAWLRATMSKSQLAGMLLASFAFFLYGARQSFQISELIDGYYIWHFQFVLQFILAALSISLYLRFSDGEQKIFMFCGLVMYVVVGLAAVLLGANEGGRVHLVFGPNVLYRVVGFLTVLAVAHSLVAKRWVVMIAILIFTALLTLMIGSRGGLIMFVPLVVFISHFLLGRYNLKNLLLGAGVLTCLGFVFINYLVGMEVDSRMLTLSVEDRYSSAGLRYYYFIWFFQNISHIFLSFGIDYSFFYEAFGSAGFLYPHNFFIELLRIFRSAYKLVIEL